MNLRTRRSVLIFLALGCLIKVMGAAQGIDLPEAIERGRQLYKQKRCADCHSLDGSTGPGPTFKGLYRSQRRLESGETVVADEAYLTESIAHPLAKVVKGYSAISMFTTSPPGSLSGEQIEDLVAFIKSLKEQPARRRKSRKESAMRRSTFEAAVVWMEEALTAEEPVAYNYPSLVWGLEISR